MNPVNELKKLANELIGPPNAFEPFDGVIRDRETMTFRLEKYPPEEELKRYVADAYYPYVEKEGEFDIEEIDIDAKNEAEAEEIAEKVLKKEYQEGWVKIEIRGPMTGLYL
jgi:hypothetical protein